MVAQSISLRAVLYREGDAWVAHCLEFDLCGDGATVEAALDSLTDAVLAQIRFSVEENNLANLFSPAEPKFWSMFAAGKNIAQGRVQIKDIESVHIETMDARQYEGDLCGV